MSDEERFFSHPSEFEPLLPERRIGELERRAESVIERSLRLTGACHPSTVESIRSLLREMNSYYSNRIEGQSTHPFDIARALRHEYASDESTASLQRLAIAHMRAEQALEGPATEDVLRMDFLRRAHAAIYSHLPSTDLLSSRNVQVAGGEFRANRVVVGRHVAPEPSSLVDFARRFDTVYSVRRAPAQSLVAIAAAHHRAMWVHPFEDGNGRSVRLQTHCALFPVTRGMWSVSRGLARSRDDYYSFLAHADQPRAGDLDGRGHLSDAALAVWCEWFIDLCADQIDFMAGLLELGGVHRRLRSLVVSRSGDDSRYRVETITPLFHLFATGPTSRNEFLQMTGLGQRTARSALAHLIDVGLVTATSHKSPVRIAFPLDSLHIVFPGLYPEADFPAHR